MIWDTAGMRCLVSKLKEVPGPDHPRTPDPFLLKPGELAAAFGDLFGVCQGHIGMGAQVEWTDP